MKVLIDILHPAHVHKLKHLIWGLQEKGHNVLITAREKEVTFQLLNAYKFQYKTLSKIGTSIPSLGKELITRYIKLYKICKRHKPDLLMGVSGTNISLIGKITRIPTLVLTETEDPKLAGKLGFYFADEIVTPSQFQKDFGKKHIRFNSFLELAYLHPNYFKPDPKVLKELGIKSGEKYSLIRFISWDASHDVFEKGFDIGFKRRLINELEKYGKVFISSEKKMLAEFQKYQIKISPEKMHHIQYFANFYVGDSQTMATEAGLLGTPSIRCNSLVGTMHGAGQFHELEKYGLVHSFKDKEMAFNKIKELLKNGNAKESWKIKREKILNEKIDTTAFLLNLIEGKTKNDR
jgi:uncharacterized protein